MHFLLAWYTRYRYKHILSIIVVESVDEGPTVDTENMLTFSKPLMALTGAYLVPLPFSFVESCLTGYRYESKIIRAVIASWYWWLCGVNFLIYFLTSPRIRQAYTKFLEDIITLSSRTKEKNEEENAQKRSKSREGI